MKVIKNVCEFLLVFLICALLFVSMIVICSVLSSMSEPKETVFWVAGDKTSLIFIFEIIIILYVAPKLYGLRNVENRFTEVEKFIKKHWLKMLLIYVAFVYIIVTDTTYISGNKILHKSFFNPVGTQYSYNDVTGIDAGFYGKNNFLAQSKGTFYYFIRLKDGTRIDLNNAGKVNTDRISNYETYKEIEEFDNKIMNLDVTKISNSDYMELSGLDVKYTERFLKIINNK